MLGHVRASSIPTVVAPHRDFDRPRLSDDTMAALRLALAHRAHGDAVIGEMKAALERVCEESHARALEPEHVVLALRASWSAARRPHSVSADEWEVEYLRVLGQCLGMFFDEA
jgi:hypothetical protein